MSYLLCHAPIVAKDRQHLWDLVLEIIMIRGHMCDLNHIDVSGVTDFALLFTSLQFEGNISRWDVSNAVDMSGMFEQSAFNGDISQWNVSNVQTMAFMFARSPFNRSLAAWNVSNARDMNWMFRKNYAFQQDLSAWNTSKVKNTEGMFEDSVYSGDISMWRLDALEEAADMMDDATLSRMPNPGFYHWYALLDNPNCLSGHPKEHALVQHANSRMSVLHGMGMSHIQAAHCLHRAWQKHRVAPPMSMELPALDL